MDTLVAKFARIESHRYTSNEPPPSQPNDSPCLMAVLAPTHDRKRGRGRSIESVTWGPIEMKGISPPTRVWEAQGLVRRGTMILFVGWRAKKKVKFG